MIVMPRAGMGGSDRGDHLDGRGSGSMTSAITAHPEPPRA